MNLFVIKCFIFIIFLTLIILFLTYNPAKSNHYITYISSFQITQPRYVFFDLGVNNGDSLLEFFDMKSQGNVGGKMSYTRFGSKAVSAKWEIYAFEANPLFNPILEKIRVQLAHNHTIRILNETAVWKYDGKIDFYLDTVNPNEHFWGSSLDKDHPDVVKSGRKKVTVKCMDFARVLKQYNENDFIVVKMDIEGSEYELILDLVKKDALKLIDHMAVEFHPTVTRLKTVDSVFLEILKIFNTNYIYWH